jgi:predicted RNase H-like HicB family nuclease
MWYHKYMKYLFSAVFTKEEKGYSVWCPELGVASQGEDLEEAEHNIREAVQLYIEEMPKEELESYSQVSKETPVVKVLEFSRA